jgi:RNA 2',3'-cyclic 3'-phosphodiesterase
MAACYGERSMMETSTRLFLALGPSAALCSRLQAEQRRWSWTPPAKQTPQESLHLTLLFIGPVPSGRVTDIAQGLALPFADFTFQLNAAEVWPNRCAVLTGQRPPPALLDLHAALAEAMRRLQLPVEARAFCPHVTLARKAVGAMPPTTAPLSWRVRSYALVQSAQGRYTPVAHYAQAMPA